MKRTAMIGLLATALATGTGCGSKTAEWPEEAAQYATYATQIPLYPGTKIEDAMGSESWGDEAGTHIYGMTFWCLADATKTELIAWYTKALPGATREDVDDGAVVLTVAPKGGSEGEDMGVYFDENGKYRVFEHTRKQKDGT